MSADTEKNGTKPVIHDATPSWNGFNYQGKVGLYVCLCIIKEQLKKSWDSVDAPFEYFERCMLEYEWIEDFSILLDNKYLSIHQVKHYNNSIFSSYATALETIVLRKAGIVSTTVLMPFIHAGKNESAEDIAEGMMISLVTAGIISCSGNLQSEWREKIFGLNLKHKDEAIAALESFDELFKKAYDNNTPVFVHTSLPIGKPAKKLENYSWASKATSALLKNIENFDQLNIKIETSSSDVYKLSLDDTALEASIRTLIREIRLIIKPELHEFHTNNSMECYLAGLLLEVDRHISMRHARFRKPTKKTATSLPNDQLLKLSVLVDVLKKEFRVHDREFFALRSKMILERAVLARLGDLNAALVQYKKVGTDAEEITREKERLLQYRDDVISKIGHLELLDHLERSSPHLKKEEPHDVFYSTISQPDVITRILISFITSLKLEVVNFFATCSNDERYSPSCIDVSDSLLPPELANNEAAMKIIAACETNSFTNALLYNFHYIAIKTKGSCSTPCLIEPPNFYDVKTESTVDSNPVFYEKKGTRLIDLTAAARKINGESC